MPVWRDAVSYEFMNKSGGMLTPISTLLYQHGSRGKNTSNHSTSSANGVSGTGISRHRGLGSIHCGLVGRGRGRKGGDMGGWAIISAAS